MREFFQKCSVAYLAGAIGGLGYAATAWAGDRWHWYTALNVRMGVGNLDWGFLIDRMVKGSLWAFLLVFLTPWFKPRGMVLGLVVSLLPSAYTLLIQYPQMGLGFMGAAKGSLVWVFILLFNAIWGMITAGLYSLNYRS